MARMPRFWQGWEALQARAWPLRRRRRLRAGEVGTEIGHASRLLLTLRGARTVLGTRRLPSGRAAGRAGSARPATAT